MPKVNVKYDNLPDGKEVEIPYLGVFKNNSTTEVSELSVKRFVRLTAGSEKYEGAETLLFPYPEAETEDSSTSTTETKKKASSKSTSKTNDDNNDK